MHNPMIIDTNVAIDGTRLHEAREAVIKGACKNLDESTKSLGLPDILEMLGVRTQEVGEDGDLLIVRQELSLGDWGTFYVVVLNALAPFCKPVLDERPARMIINCADTSLSINFIDGHRVTYRVRAEFFAIFE